MAFYVGDISSSEIDFSYQIRLISVLVTLNIDLVVRNRRAYLYFSQVVCFKKFIILFTEKCHFQPVYPIKWGCLSTCYTLGYTSCTLTDVSPLQSSLTFTLRWVSLTAGGRSVCMLVWPILRRVKLLPHEGHCLHGQTLIPIHNEQQDEVISVKTKETELVLLFLTTQFPWFLCL